MNTQLYRGKTVGKILPGCIPQAGNGTISRNHNLGLRVSTLIMAVILILSLSQCSTMRIKRELKQVAALTEKDKVSPYLKVHMKSGGVYVFDKWDVYDQTAVLNGNGRFLNFNRELIEEGSFTVHFDEIALCETNILNISSSIAAMTIITVPSVLLSGLCIINPKACFGSCPTFYAWDGAGMTLQAEAFSTCIAPAMESTDIDMLYAVKPERRDFRLQVTNEALETHVIRSAQLLALPRPENGKTFKSTSGEFWMADIVSEPVGAKGPEGDCLSLVTGFDRQERFSAADPDYLAEKETLEFTFNATPGKKAGLVIGFRQTLLTTYLLYQGIAYMGSTYGYWLSMLEQENSGTLEYVSSIGKLLGGIDILVQDENNKWKLVETIYETGPIASDVWLVVLDSIQATSMKIQLRMTKGLWRIDYLALAGLVKMAEPLRLQPALVFNKNEEDRQAREALLDREKNLVTLPGDIYTLVYRLPEDYGNYELFLESRGYYLEWMRPAWLEEEDHEKAIMMFSDSKAFLRECAPAYKKLEPEMEAAFWGSKYESK